MELDQADNWWRFSRILRTRLEWVEGAEGGGREEGGEEGRKEGRKENGGANCLVSIRRRDVIWYSGRV